MDSTDISDERPRFSWSRVVLASLPILAAIAVVAAYVILTDHWKAQAELESDGLTRFGLARPTSNRLAERFDDANGDLVADPPQDAAALVDPETLTFSYIAGEEPQQQAQAWHVFLEHLAEQTNRKLEYVFFSETDEQLRALNEGSLHIAGLSTGTVPVAVDACGFVPVATLGRADGSFGYQMQIIVPADSPLKNVEDLRGRQLTFTARNSNSGYKAPIVLLKTEFGLLPDRDYSWGFSHAHSESIARIAAGDLDAAAVASDMLARAVADKAIQEDAVRAIYESERFPPAALGYAFNLKPELAAKLREAMLSFQFAGTTLEAEFAGAEVTQFVPVDYKNDWATIRRMDETLGLDHTIE